MRIWVVSAALALMTAVGEAQVIHDPAYDNPIALNFVFELPTDSQAQQAGIPLEQARNLWNLGSTCYTYPPGRAFLSENCYEVPNDLQGGEVSVTIKSLHWSAGVEAQNNNFSLVIAVLVNPWYANRAFPTYVLFIPVQMQKTFTASGSVTLPMPAIWSGSEIQVVPLWRNTASLSSQRPARLMFNLSLHR